MYYKHNCVLSNAGLSNALNETGICTSLKADFYFQFHSPLNTNWHSALVNFTRTWDLVLICWKSGHQSLKTAEIGIHTPLKSANYFRFRHRCDLISTVSHGKIITIAIAILCENLAHYRVLFSW